MKFSEQQDFVSEHVAVFASGIQHFREDPS